MSAWSRPGGVSSIVLQSRARFYFFLFQSDPSFLAEKWRKIRKQQRSANSWKLKDVEKMKDAERGEKGSFSALRRKAGGARQQKDSEKGRKAHAFTKQPVSRTLKMSWLHKSICPYLSKFFVRRRFASWELALKVPGHFFCAFNSRKHMQQQMEAGAGGFSRRWKEVDYSVSTMPLIMITIYSQRFTCPKSCGSHSLWFFSDWNCDWNRDASESKSPGLPQGQARARRLWRAPVAECGCQVPSWWHCYERSCVRDMSSGNRSW